MSKHADGTIKSYFQTPAKHASIPGRIGGGEGADRRTLRMAGHVFQADALDHPADGPAGLAEIRAMIDRGESLGVAASLLGIVETWLCKWAAAAEYEAAQCEVRSLADLFKADADACRKHANALCAERARAESLLDERTNGAWRNQHGC